MLDGQRVAVVVPAHDEARLIGRTVRSIPDWVDDVVVVDDGSSDGTAQVVQGLGAPRVRLVRHPHNRGVGAALGTGYAAAFAGGADVVAVMAGDAQMDPGDLPALLAPVLAGEADYAKGDRLSHPRARRDMPWARWVGNHVLSLLTRWATGLAVRDSQCGYTALSRHAAERLPLHALWPRYGYPNDLLGHAAVAGLRVRDVTVRAVYGDERSGIRLWHAVGLIPALLVRIAVRRLVATATPGRYLPARPAPDARLPK
jgi:glycosyltransferase involved in cell wall biosynthesis